MACGPGRLAHSSPHSEAGVGVKAELEGTCTGEPDDRRVWRVWSSTVNRFSSGVQRSLRHAPLKLNVSMVARATYLLLLLGILTSKVSPGRVKRNGGPPHR